jgi:hypothetical protein
VVSTPSRMSALPALISGPRRTATASDVWAGTPLHTEASLLVGLAFVLATAATTRSQEQNPSAAVRSCSNALRCPSCRQAVDDDRRLFGTFDVDGSWRWLPPLVAATLSGAARRTGGAYEHSSARPYVGRAVSTGDSGTCHGGGPPTGARAGTTASQAEVLLLE